ncbi:MAG: sigma-70 family RNA polymerase sigma factor [Pseudomonadota bacterium]
MDDLGAVLKSARPRALAALRRLAGELSRAEDAFQDAAEQALEHWPKDGLPDNPAAWLVQVGRRRLIDWARRDRFSSPLEEEPAQDSAEPANPLLEDDLLRLVFTCCHPALAPDAQAALTLKVIAGLPTEDVAQAFLVPVRTMEQRLTRARSKLRNAGIPFRVPAERELPERLDVVLAVVYLIFNQGYSPRRLTTTEPRLCREAIWLARLLRGLFPGNPELTGLLALMLFHHARHNARVTASGLLVPLPEQDRGSWDRRMIAEASTLLRHVLGKGAPGPYQTQAAIAALHCEAANAHDTDWQQIAALYAVLERQQPSPVVTINRAVALGKAGAAAAGVALLETLKGEPALDTYVPFWLACSELERLTGNRATAARCHRQAISLTVSEAERQLLESEHQRLFSSDD